MFIICHKIYFKNVYQNNLRLARETYKTIGESLLLISYKEYML